MEIILPNGDTFAFADTDIVYAGLLRNPDRCEVHVRGLAAGAVLRFTEDAEPVFRRCKAIIDQRERKKQTLAGYMAAMDN